ncbi:MAG: hypothetical protein WA716_18790, partial [Pseudolabrys sp.]
SRPCPTAFPSLVSKVPPKPGYGPWELSADRANAVRQILDVEGVPSGNIYMVAGKVAYRFKQGAA